MQDAFGEKCTQRRVIVTSSSLPSFKLLLHCCLIRLPKSDIVIDAAYDKIVSRGRDGMVLGLKNDTVNKTFTAYCDSAYAGADSLTLKFFGYKFRFIGCKKVRCTAQSMVSPSSAVF